MDMKENKMNIQEMVNTLKARSDAHKIGMIASHLGIVRATSRSGPEVQGIDVIYDKDALSKIIKDIREMEGIIDVLVDINEGRLAVGDDILAVAVAGDIREHVFSALITAVNRIKKESSQKKEIFVNVS
jgi:molybdopterin synthase catalytic subunit